MQGRMTHRSVGIGRASPWQRPDPAVSEARIALALPTSAFSVHPFLARRENVPVVREGVCYVGRRPTFVDLMSAYTIITTLEPRRINSGKRTHVHCLAA